MHWALEQGSGKTITQLWSESEGIMDYLLPSGEDDFIEGSYEDA